VRQLNGGMLVSLLLALGSCGPQAPVGAGADGVGAPEAQSGASRVRVETVAEGLEVPWSLVFTPDGRLLVAERPGRVRVVADGRLLPEPLHVVPDVEHRSESGLMGLTLHPRFAENRLLYLAYAYSEGGDERVRVVRFREGSGGLAERKVIIEAIPAAPNHAGCRLRFGPDGMLYVTTGDATDRTLAQRLDSLAGKTLRLTDEGGVPADNPFVGRAGARPEIWSYGHRNAQGLDWQPGSGLMVQTEHGPSGFDGPGGGDEVNIVERGKNYGWPLVHHRDSRQGLESPLLEFTPAVAPASGAFYRGSRIPGYSGNYFFGALRGESVYRVSLDGRRVTGQERMFHGEYGRIRDVAEGPDGALYFSTSNRDGRGRPAKTDDRILRIVPAR
jgi:glucose/arabinose dehydrogenase